MRLHFLILSFFLVPGQLLADCNKDLIRLESWAIEPIDADTNLLTTNFTYLGSKPVRLIDASAQFSDILGEEIGSFALTRDVSFVAGSAHQEVGRWGQYTFERLLDMNRDDVVTSVCVRAIVYSDGTIEEF